jgi:hypothetical protein
MGLIAQMKKCAIKLIYKKQLGFFWKKKEIFKTGLTIFPREQRVAAFFFEASKQRDIF